VEEQKIKDTRTVEQIVDDMDLFDDDLMSMVFDGNIEATELMLGIILKRDDIKVVSVVGQREFQNPVVGGRNIRLDILAKDRTGKNYNVEVQKKPEGAHIRRARFNSSKIRIWCLSRRQIYLDMDCRYIP
jgi:hypothetical protein